MRMTTARLIAFRIFGATLGRIAWLNRLTRWLLVEILIRRRPASRRYVASARFFEPSQLDR